MKDIKVLLDVTIPDSIDPVDVADFLLDLLTHTSFKGNFIWSVNGAEPVR